MSNTTFQLVVASLNPKKKHELDELLKESPVEVLAGGDVEFAPDVIEDGDSFEHNASKKAAEWALANRAWALADDSGLVVDALGGAPGVHSARYAEDEVSRRPTDAENNAKLLREIVTVDEAHRTAHFVCVLALADPRGRIRIMTMGTADGHILERPRGEGGFGYDPLFEHRSGKTFAELSMDEKAHLSHRGQAMHVFCGALNAMLERIAENEVK